MNIILKTLLVVTVALLSSTVVRAQVIDFETVPGDSPADQLAIRIKVLLAPLVHTPPALAGPSRA